jgi:hypothetical protein
MTMCTNEQISSVLGKLRHNGFDAVLVENAEAARDKICQIVPPTATVGVANSVTVRQTGALEVLKQRGNVVIDPLAQAYGFVEFNEATFIETFRKSLGTDVFLSGANAVTEDGKLVSIDGVGNRIAGVIWGSRKSIIVVGRNKIVKDLNEAIFRIKNTITPALARRREVPLPCVKAGRCVDCSVPQRACNITVVIEKRPTFTEMSVLMVDDDLGLAWDPDWPEERIERIKRRYEDFDWPYVSTYEAYKVRLRTPRP